MKNQILHASVIAALVSGAQTATNDATGVDVTGLEGPGLVILNAGAATAGTDPTLNIHLEHSDAVGGTYVDVANGAFAEVTDAAASLQTIFIPELSALNGFVRAAIVVGGTSSPSFPVSIEIVAIPKVYPQA